MIFGRGDNDQQFYVHVATSDGVLASVVTLSENYWRFVEFQSVMGNSLKSNCDMSKKEWRLFR